MAASLTTLTRDDEGRAVRSARSERALHRFLAAQMRALSAVPGRTKRTAARLALVAAMRDGHLTPGAHLPPEKALTQILDVSLGTVQAALRQLQQAGTIVRRRGDGTRVASVEPLSDTVWHFRFLAKSSGMPLRFVKQEVAIDRTTASGPWAEFLAGASEFIRVRRHMTMSGQTYIAAEMYLDARVAGPLAEIDPQELDMINIRPYLEEAFGLFTASARHSIQTTTLGSRAADVLGLRPGKPYFEIHAKAVTAERSPVYFQRIFAAVSDCILDF